jgi:general secretion pathway protein C
MFARLASFVIWSLVAAATVFWALRFGVQGPQVPSYAIPVDRSAPAQTDLARMFGTSTVVASSATRPETPSRFRLLGVMAPKSKALGPSASYGLALIAVDGKPAKAFTVGARLDDGLVLQSVGLRTASLGPAAGGRTVLLELPVLPAPATGVLPVPGTGMGAAAMPRPVPTPQGNPSVTGPPPAMNAVGSAPGIQGQPVPLQAAPVPNPNLPAPDSVGAQ